MKIEFTDRLLTSPELPTNSYANAFTEKPNEYRSHDTTFKDIFVIEFLR